MKTKKSKFLSLLNRVDSIFKPINALGLDISDFSIEALQLKSALGKITLEAFNRVYLEKGTVEDGEIISKSKLVQKIEELLDGGNFKKSKTTEVVLSIPESRAFLHVFDLPANISAKELPGAIESEVAKTMPIDVTKSYSDFRVVSRGLGTQEVLYATASKDIIDDYLEVMEKVGLNPVALDIESASIARTFKDEMLADAAVLIVDIGARTTTLTIVDEGAIRVSSIIKTAGGYFTRTISEKLNIPIEEAEKIKRIYGMNEAKGEGKVMFIMQDVLRDTIVKTKKLVNFYEAKSKRKVKKVLLSGGSSLMPGMLSYLGDNLDIETRLANPAKMYPKLNRHIQETFLIKDIISPKELEKKGLEYKMHPVMFSNVIGLAIRGLSFDPEDAGLNLIPEILRPTRPTFISKQLSRSESFNMFVVIATLLVFIFFLWVIYSYILINLLKSGVI
jgi:type IV pilus assembly protein PilM